MKNKKIKYSQISLLILTILSFLAAFYFSSFISKKNENYQIVKNFEKKLHEKESLAESILTKISTNLKNSKTISFKTLADSYNSEFNINNGLSIFIYRNDSLLFWSDNSIPITDKFYDAYQNDDYIRLKNGSYIIKKNHENLYTIISLILIKTEYKYNNDYLINNFHRDFHISSDYSITNNITRNNIHDKKGKFLFSLKQGIMSEKNQNERNAGISSLLYLLSFVFMFAFLVKVDKYLYLQHKNILLNLLFIGFFVLFRIVIFYFKIPQELYSLTLFGPTIYATSELLPSFGDFILNVLIFAFIAFYIFRNFNIDLNKIKIFKIWLLTIASLFSLLPLFFSDITVYLIKSLIINSNISFNVNNIFELTTYSYVGFVLIGLIIISFFLFIERISRFLIYRLVNFKEFLIVVLTTTILYIGIELLLFKVNIIYLLPFLAVYIISAYNLSKHKRSINVSTVTIYLIVFTFFTNVVLYNNNDYKEKEKRKSIALRLSKKGDPIGEYLFGEINNQIKDDNRITNLIKMYPFSESDLTKIIQNYFSGYWSKYDLQITVCKQGDKLIIKPNDIEVDCNYYFNDKIKSNIAKQPNYENFYNVNTNTGRNSYIAIFTYKPTRKDSLIPYTKIFLELDSKFIPKELGYPELLIDNKVNINRDYGNYSYAKYYNNEELLQFGQFFYSLNVENYKDFSSNEFNFFCQDNYDHLLYKTENTTVIVSKKSDSVFNIISPFSYLFGFNFLLVIIVLLLMNIPLNRSRWKINFKNRVQLSMISVVLVSFVFIGGGTVYYIVSLYNTKNLDIITEKTHSVLVEIERKFSDKKELSEDMTDVLSEQLVRYSNVFFTDVNLFDVNGNLLASSRQKIFDEGLVSTKMNTDAYVQLKTYEKNQYVHDENIGKLKYLSAYIPFRNDENKIIAYLNLPYFAKQSELKKEISSFLVKFINIYVLLIALAILIALIISNRITKPLRLIRDNLSRIMLGKSNEKIIWTKKDEIGSLIKEYNRMIDELEQSAELLAKSERESAWREMAKQVAHEIKNPLTPMKLSVQYLQKAWKDKASNWDERLDKFSKTIIEQIDSLSAIASEFSNFAKMPRSKNEAIELSELIQSIIELYSNFENIEINFIKEEGQQYYVFADKKQFLRVFNNLIKNSMQAFEEKKKGIINISIFNNIEYYKISISDNGSGISKEQLNKIFSPNFTTKTGGMGLGLAMVKSIIESAEGTISFHSEEGVGTTFDIILPVHKSF